jgi:hypothetical protein
MHIGLQVKYPFLSHFNETWLSWTNFEKNTQLSNFMKILPLRAEFHADGRADGRTYVTNLIVGFSQFCERT